jgi:hypothetical protein
MTEQLPTSHFWVSSYPFLESTLLVVPGAVSREGAAAPLSSFDTRLSLYDPDGGLINDASVSCRPTEMTVIELEPFMGACKVESGMRHAHLAASAPHGARLLCRLHNNEGAFLQSDAFRITPSASAFFPITVQASRRNFLCCLNEGDDEASVRCRLFSGKRMPECTLTIPARGVRLVPLELEFKEFSEVEGERSFQMYLRLGLRAGTSVTAQHVERFETAGEAGVFSALC